MWLAPQLRSWYGGFRPLLPTFHQTFDLRHSVMIRVRRCEFLLTFDRLVKTILCLPLFRSFCNEGFCVFRRYNFVGLCSAFGQHRHFRLRLPEPWPLSHVRVSILQSRRVWKMPQWRTKTNEIQKLNILVWVESGCTFFTAVFQGFLCLLLALQAICQSFDRINPDAFTSYLHCDVVRQRRNSHVASRMSFTKIQRHGHKTRISSFSSFSDRIGRQVIGAAPNGAWVLDALQCQRSCITTPCLSPGEVDSFRYRKWLDLFVPSSSLLQSFVLLSSALFMTTSKKTAIGVQSQHISCFGYYLCFESA